MSRMSGRLDDQLLVPLLLFRKKSAADAPLTERKSVIYLNRRILVDFENA